MEVLPHNSLIMGYILITGSSSGIGREVAINLSVQYDIILHGRDLNRLEETKSLCDKRHSVIIWKNDLSDINQLENSLSDFIINNRIEISKFVHCAGYCKNLPLKMISKDVLETTFNINVFSALLITKTLCSKKLNKNSLNNIVFISSNISGFGAKAHTVYGASKMAVDGMMKSLAIELAPRIRVNTILPGAVKTAMTEHIYEDEELIKRMENFYPLGLGTTKNISDAINFLLSEESSWITGHQLVVDGGRTSNITG